MDMYTYYKKARDTAWEVLINCQIKSLPVDLQVIANFYKIEIALYSQSPISQAFNPEVISGDGFITQINNTKVIFLNDKIKTRGRRRFTLAHELGHGILNHPLDNIIARNRESDSTIDPLELQGNIFSRDILAPACILNALNVTTSEEIINICDISKQSAEIRLQRLQILQKRKAFGYSPLERQVLKQFQPFIKMMNGSAT